MKSRMPWAMALAGAACASLAIAPAAMAGLQPKITVVGKSLNNPRGLAAAPDGSIYVAEAGKAGPTCLDRRRENCAGFSSAATSTSRRSASAASVTASPAGENRE